MSHEKRAAYRSSALVEPGVVEMGQVEEERARVQGPDQPRRGLETPIRAVVAAEAVVGLVVPGQRKTAQRVLAPQQVQRVGSDTRKVEAFGMG